VAAINHPFAPNTITRHTSRIGAPAQRRELVRWLQLALVAVALTGCTALGAGFLARLFFGV
jgi:hypothetical protein